MDSGPRLPWSRATGPSLHAAFTPNSMGLRPKMAPFWINLRPEKEFFQTCLKHLDQARRAEGRKGLTPALVKGHPNVLPREGGSQAQEAVLTGKLREERP